jgi:hypothetical protein
MSEKEKARHQIMATVGFGFVLLAVYLLSIGAVAKLGSYNVIPTPAPPAVRSFYAPIFYVADHSPAAHKLYMWYIYTVWGVPRVNRRSMPASA